MGLVRAVTALMLAATVSASCQTPEAADDKGGGPTHYTLELGPSTRYPEPLGRETDVLVDWHQKEGGSRRVKGFRGWDYDGDGRFEMVEVLTPEGQVKARVFDFDGDGKVDLTKEP